MKNSDENQCIVAGEAAAAVAGRSDTEEKPTAFLKLIADCWEHIFDYLSFRDILQMGQTCIRMNRMAGYYIREYHPQLQFELKEGKVYMHDVCLQTEFYPFIGRLSVWQHRNNALTFMSNANRFDALKTVEFRFIELSEIQIEYMSKALKNVENINFFGCKIIGNFCEQFANICSKLKEMKVFYSTVNDALFFSQYYPNLEFLQYYPTEFSRIDELKTFLEKHLKLKQFHIQFEFLWANRDVLIQTNIRLDLLNIRFLTRTDPFDEFIEFLTLYGCNFYNALQLSFYPGIQHIDRDHMTHVISSLPRLEKLCTSGYLNLDLGRFTNLKELQIQDFAHTTTNTETLAKGLSKLEQLVVSSANIETILPFIRHTKNLQTIKIDVLDGSSLDLAALNNERKTLENACQVSIYVKDGVYLCPKWKSNNFKLELDLVKIVRLDSFDWIF